MRRSRTMPLLLASVLLVPACGARLDSETRQAAAAGTLQQAGAAPVAGGPGGAAVEGTTGAAVDGTTGTGTAAGPAAGGTGAGTTGGGGGTAGATGGGSTGAAAAAAPAGGNGGAVDVGVTGDDITLGNISDLSGPVPGLFQGAVIGTQAYIAKVNSEGGVFGRKLKLRVGDGQLDCDQNTALHRSLSPKVFAFVGSFSLYDGCGAKVLQTTPNLPDVHNALAANAGALPNNFSIAPLTPGWRTGPLTYYKQKYGDAFKNIGTIYAEGRPACPGSRSAR